MQPPTRNRPMADGPTADGRIRGDAIRLYTLLKEFTEPRTQTVRSLDTYDEVLWFADIPRQPECDCVMWQDPGEGAAGETSEVWLEVHKPRIPALPDPPPSLRPWLST